MEKLMSLSPEQQKKMLEVKKQWLDYIFSCRNSKINKEAAKVGIDWMYKLSGLNGPIIIYVGSPMACQYAVAYVKEFVKMFPVLKDKKAQVRAQVRAQVWAQVRAQVRAQVGDQVGAQVGDQVGAQVRAQVWDQVRAQVGDQVWAQVGAQVWAQVGAQVWDQVRAQVWAQVWDQVRAQVGDQVWAQVWDQVRAQVRDQVRAQVGDQVRAQVRDQLNYEAFSSYGNIWDYGWVSFFDFFQQIGVFDHKGFAEFKNLLQSGVYDMIQLHGFCIVSSLPSKIIRNNNGRLHNPVGPAIEFADGYKLYFINGRALPSWIWEKASAGEITKEIFLNERNSDIKGGMYEVLGQKRMMDMLGAEVVDKQQIIHANGDIENVELLKTKERFSEIGNEPFAWVKMICPSTGTQYLQGVEPHHTNAREAIASLSPFKAEDYSFDYRS